MEDMFLFLFLTATRFWPSTDSVYTECISNKCYIMNGVKLTHASAETACLSHGSDWGLLIIGGDDEMSYIDNLAAMYAFHQPAHIGMTRDSVSHPFRWHDGSLPFSGVWMEGQPQESKLCAALKYENNVHRAFSEDCQQEIGFMCENGFSLPTTVFMLPFVPPMTIPLPANSVTVVPSATSPATITQSISTQSPVLTTPTAQTTQTVTQGPTITYSVIGRFHQTQYNATLRCPVYRMNTRSTMDCARNCVTALSNDCIDFGFEKSSLYCFVFTETGSGCANYNLNAVVYYTII